MVNGFVTACETNIENFIGEGRLIRIDVFF